MNAPMQSDSSPIPQAWPWPDGLDALVAAPDHHKLLLENDRVRVLTTRIAPGHRTPVHTHRWPGVLYILSWSNFMRYDDQGKVLVDSRRVDAFKHPPTVVWSSPLPPHSLQNIGETDLNIIAIELKGETA
jgi:predicted metal-dependent enzyme (double-stranded beta helix superfamily)